MPSQDQALGGVLSIRDRGGSKDTAHGVPWVETGIDPQSNYDTLIIIIFL